MQDVALSLVELHGVHMGPTLQFVKVPLDGIPSQQCINCTIQFGFIHKFADSTLSPTIYLINEDMR